MDVLEAFRALEGFAPRCERRKLRRTRYYTAAQMLVSLDGPATVYTRDVNPWLIGLVGNVHLDNYDHVMLHLPLPDQPAMEVECTVRRCQEFLPGWFDYALHFRHEQPLFCNDVWLARPSH
jgi:hypothetical protein